MAKAGQDKLTLKSSEILSELYLKRKSHRRSYSARAFARDLGISHSLLSYILNGKRSLSLKRAMQISSRLNLSAFDEERLIDSVVMDFPGISSDGGQLNLLKKYRRARGLSVFRSLDIERYRTIRYWYHFAILDLPSTAGFESDTQWIAKRLGIPATSAQKAIDELLTLGMIEWNDGKLRKVNEFVGFFPEISLASVRDLHRQLLSKAMDELDKSDEASFSARNISAVTFAIKKERLEEAKLKIHKFRNEMTEFLTEGQSDDLYQMNLQLFPLTKPV